MHSIQNVRFKGYKAFPNNVFAEMNSISQMNVIIGKNNCGKTSLLEIIEKVFDSESRLKIGSDVEEIQIDIPFSSQMVDRIFSTFSGIGMWRKTNLTEYVKDKVFPCSLSNANTFDLHDANFRDLGGQLDRACAIISDRRGKYKFRKITAERNIHPEVESDHLILQSNGDGASNLVATFLNDSKYDENVIEKTFLNALNSIMQPEAKFQSIRVQQVNYDGRRLWEVFLQEEGLPRIPLSKTGSGLKTVVLVLLNLLVVPHINEYKDKTIVYGFEELENNLHPALQRRLFEYIYDYTVENRAIVFMTTHSHIAINALFDKESASIYHVVKENGQAQIKAIDTYIDKVEILEDLDVKASDILQSNGIIWVEGPSDRVYLKRWLEVFTPNEYEEGKHYQFLYYGGRLLSQYSAKEETDLINIITTNRNAAIVIDSDKRYAADSINDTKKRIVGEFNKLKMFSWVTKGKEIENYLPKQAVEHMLGVTLRKSCGQYQLFPDFIKKHYKSFANRKVPFANTIKEHISKDNSAGVMDLSKQIAKLYNEIAKWNH